MSEETKLPTVSVELDAYDLMVLEDAIHRTEGQGWSSDESNDRAKVRDKLIEAYAKLPPPPPLDLVESLGSPALSPLDVLWDLNALLGIPSEFLRSSPPLKVISAHQEGDTTVLLLSAPLDSISFTARLDEPKISNDIKPCPLCEFVLDPNGECVNHRCPNWIKE